jgi:hypothetical protein
MIDFISKRERARFRKRVESTLHDYWPNRKGMTQVLSELELKGLYRSHKSGLFPIKYYPLIKRSRAFITDYRNGFSPKVHVHLKVLRG